MSLSEAPRTAHAGLASAEAAARIRRDGPNLLPAPRPPAAWRVLLAQMTHFFAVMLWVAAGLALIAGMPQLGIAIAVIVVINGIFAFVQEHRAERATERLRDLLPRRATVLRDGTARELDVSELVVGDLVLLAAGDRISADARVTEAHSLALDTSTLTGESVPAAAGAGESVFAGTFVVEGEARAEVTATGSRTRLAAIALRTRAGRRPPSQLARELDGVVRTVAWIAVGLGVVFFAIAALVGLPYGAGFLFAIGITVALVPEGLLPTLTLSLAVAARRMAARGALVRRLESVETLGSTTFLCTDKTGTLTLNQMAVVEIWTPAGRARIEGVGYEPRGEVRAGPGLLPALRELARVAARCSTGRAVLEAGRWVAQGDPMEAALAVLARRLEVDVTADERERPVSRRFPFDARRRRMSIVAGGTLLVKGAPDAVLPRCREMAGAEEALDAMAERGLRVIAIASRPFERAAVSPSSVGAVAAGMPPSRLADAAEVGLDLLGLVGLEDPPRPGAAQAIASCRRAGIRVAMVSGDHEATARAIAREVGLLAEPGLVLQGRDLPADEALLGALVDRDGVVISRVSPEDKFRIARALRRRGHVVAMTGDGVNDGPALHEADIGVAMGRAGTDVAREASDLVLLDDNLATIVAAVEQGRATYSNIRRVLTYHMTDNVAELTPFAVWALSGGRFPLALGVLQILCLDLGTDQLPALGLGTEAPNPRTLERTLRGRHLLDRALLQRVFLVLGPVEALMEMAAFTAVLLGSGWRPGAEFPGGSTLLAASGAAFSAVVLGQAANVFACRSTTRWFGARGYTSNPLLVVGVVVELLLLAACLFVRPLARVLGHAPPPMTGWLVAALTAPAVLLADTLHKWILQRRRARGPGRGKQAVLAGLAALAITCAPVAAGGPTGEGPAVAYRTVALRGPGSVAALRERLGPEAFAEVLRLNRVDLDHVPWLDSLVVPDPGAGFRATSPFPSHVASLGGLPKLLVVAIRVQAFAAYDSGRLVRWGPVSTGTASQPTRAGAFHVNWKSPAHRSTVDTTWLMRWCVNLDNRDGLALHQYALPGRPASHCCVRLTAQDARWAYAWLEAWRVTEEGTGVPASGTPVWLLGHYDFAAPPPWRRLPADPAADRVDASELRVPAPGGPE